MFRYKLEIEYLGDKYCGMQIQNDLDSIQSVVEESLSFFIKQVISIKFSGRTDAKVNAYNQVCHFDTEVDLNKCKLIKSLNFFLREKNIVVVDLQLVDDKFHSRFSAKKRSYRYKIILRNSPTVIERNLLWHIYHKINLIEFIDNAKYFIGHHDFNAFRSIQCQAKNSHRTIDTIEVRIFHFITKEKIFDIKYVQNLLFHNFINYFKLKKLRKINDNLESYMIYGLQIEFKIVAKSFLHNMIRNIIGTLYDISRLKVNKSIKQIIKSKDRRQAGQTAPACGLYFLKTEY